MHHAKKSAAIKKFSEGHEGKTTEELKAEILADSKGYSEEEADEIIAAIEGHGEVAGESDDEAPVKSTAKYEEWKCQKKKNDQSEFIRKGDGFEVEQIGKAPVKTVTLKPEQADRLNSHAHNRNILYVPVK
jgi:hypothetical protein